MVLTMIALPAVASAQPIVAVFSIEDAQKKDPATIQQLTEYLSGQIAEGGLYRVVPSDTLRKELLNQKVESYRECIDEGCQIEIGKALAAEKSLSTQILRLGKRCILKSTLYDLEQEVSDRVATVKSGCAPDALVDAVEKVAAKLKEGLVAATETPVDTVKAPPPPGDAELFGGRRKLNCKPAQGCYELGIAFRDGTGRPVDRRRALDHLLASCAGGYASGCTDAGYMIEQTAREDLRAAKLYTRGCDLGSALGCTNTGYMYEKGKGYALDYRLAVTFYEKGCEAGNARGCTNLGYMYRNGKGVPQSDDRALSLYRQACRANSAGGCTNLGFLYETGRGVPRNLREAAQLYERGCKAGSAVGCSNLGFMYERGRGVSTSLRNARRYYSLGCKGGNDRGCRSAERLGG